MGPLVLWKEREREREGRKGMKREGKGRGGDRSILGCVLAFSRLCDFE
jgi:hypothetical protein